MNTSWGLMIRSLDEVCMLFGAFSHSFRHSSGVTVVVMKIVGRCDQIIYVWVVTEHVCIGKCGSGSKAKCL